MNRKQVASKKAPVAVISLLPEGYGEGNRSRTGRKNRARPQGHYVSVRVRFLTYWRHGSGVTILKESFGTDLRWVKDDCFGGGAQ